MGRYRCVAYGCEDVQVRQAAQGVDGLQRATKRLMEDVADPCSPTAERQANSETGAQ